jgi:glyceraldehyde 3-phosphate dehydrogenase
VPTVTGSLVILVLALQDDPMGESIRREMINSIYQEASETDPRGYLRYSPRPNVSEDIVADPKAAAVIEVDLTHTRTAEVKIDLERIPGLDASLFSSLKERIVRVPVTQAVVYGWYDNEMGYVHMLGECLEMMAGSI